MARHKAGRGSRRSFKRRANKTAKANLRGVLRGGIRL